MLKGLLFAFTLFIFAGGSAYGQEAWSLEKCVNLALKNSLLIKSADFSLEDAKISKKLATSARLPNLNGSSNLSWNFGRTVDPTSNTFITETFLSNNFSLNTGITLFNAGRIRNSIKQSDIEYQASMMDREQTINDISLQVASSYLNVLFAQENLNNSIKQLEITREQLDQTEKLIKSGSLPANEKLDIEAQIAIREQGVINNENTYDISLLALKQLLRLDPSLEMTLEVPEEVSVISDPELLTFKEVYDQAIFSQKSVEASELRIQSADMGIKIAKSSLYPSLSFGGSLGTNYSNQGRTFVREEEMQNNTNLLINNVPATITQNVSVPIFEDASYTDQLDQNLSYGFGFNLSVPIYNNFRNKASVQQAKINKERALNNLEQTKDLIKNNVQQALADAKAAKKSLNASQKSLAAQEAAYANARKRYDLGSINSFDLATLQNQVAQAEINLLISRYDYIFRVKVLDFYMGKPITLK